MDKCQCMINVGYIVLERDVYTCMYEYVYVGYIVLEGM